ERVPAHCNRQAADGVRRIDRRRPCSAPVARSESQEFISEAHRPLRARAAECALKSVSDIVWSDIGDDCSHDSAGPALGGEIAVIAREKGRPRPSQRMRLEERTRMKTNQICFRGALTVLAASVAAAALAQPPASSEIELPEERRIPAEQTAAAYRDPSWTGPRTSWGHPSLEGTWSTDDMRGIPRDRPQQYSTAASLPQEDFLQRAMQQHSGRDRAVNRETFLRNEWGTRTFGYTSLVIDPPNGRTPPLNELGRARAESVRGQGTFGPGPFNDFDDFSLYDRCITLGINRGMGAAIYGNGIRIAQSPDTITIIYEMIHDTRVIPLDGRPHLDEAIKQYPGNSRGYWDGDTLVIA